MRAKFYKSRNGWRWTVIARNGKKMANCGQGYSRITDCRRDFSRIVGFDPLNGFIGWTVEGL